ncbi:hypothetical protein [Sphaerotilus sp.]|uniref:hypothetical protein n=1 Tax=Sphaerotilus sp. TaxID=2093942 RepID=UPI002ACE8AE9|nr:hypothetical protein [Sphaerotilus sp.]MDZ7857438.1 hypothetical protein [Sphaerotilus sp.]
MKTDLSLVSAVPAAVEDPVASAMLADWLHEYAQRDRSQSLDQWLAEMIERRAAMAREQALREAVEIIGYIDDGHVLHDDLRQHRRKGKSRSSWIAQKVESVAEWAQADPADIAAVLALLTGGRRDGAPDYATDGDWALRLPRKKTEPFVWNDVSRIDVATLIEQCARSGSAQDVLDQAGRGLLGDAADRLLADHPQARQLVQDYLEGRLDPALRNGMQATLASATALAARRGLLGAEVLEFVQGDTVMPGWFAHQTWLGTERMRVLHDLGSGRLDADEALDQLADHTTAMSTKALKEVCGRVGGKIGEKLAGMVPWIGPFLSPVGRKVGCWLGDKVGEFAGGKVGQAISKGVSYVKNTAQKVVSAVGNAVSSAASYVSSKVFSVVSSVASFFGF